MDGVNELDTGFFKYETIFLKVQLLTYKQIIAIKKFGRVQLQYEDF
ncbi:hypothetical protein [Staphylococcus aureus]|nr:hypothetical protein [Staphylococcus aureus]HCY7991863.1 hypothetical protein [Staphylococcus aureus]